LHMLCPIHACIIKCAFNKLAYGMRLSGGHNEVIRLVELQHVPHCFDIFGRVAPVTLRLEITHIELGLQTCANTRNSPADLAAYKGLSSAGRFVIEKNSITRKKAVTLPVIYRYPVRIQLGNG